MSGPGFIAPEPPGRCEMCGKRAELRPYGPNGANVCFDCGIKDEPTAARLFAKRVLGREPTEVELETMLKPDDEATT